MRMGLTSWIVGGPSCRLLWSPVFYAVGAVPGAPDDARVAAVTPGVEVGVSGDVGHDLGY